VADPTLGWTPAPVLIAAGLVLRAPTPYANSLYGVFLSTTSSTSLRRAGLAKPGVLERSWGSSVCSLGSTISQRENPTYPRQPGDSPRRGPASSGRPAHVVAAILETLHAKADPIAAATALLWIVHPLTTEGSPTSCSARVADGAFSS